MFRAPMIQTFFPVLHCGLPDLDRVEAEELDDQVRAGREGAADHEPVSDLRLQEQDLPGVSESLRRVRASL